jgi:hypothetical protein
MLNDAEMAKSLTAPELWDGIDMWISEHDALQGPIFSMDPDDNRVFEDCVPWYHEGVIASRCNYSLSSAYKGRAYHFTAKRVVLWKTEEERYQVVAWDEICESWEGEQPKCK